MINKIFITGISGFVGANLKAYLQPNYEVIGISRKHSAYDIDYKAFFECTHEYDCIIHLAGKAHDIKKVSNDRDYYEANFDLTRKIYDSFLQSKAQKFIYMSSVKAAKDSVDGILFENATPNPLTVYGKSKRMAEEYILNNLPTQKRVYILRPCMIHGPGNKGNINLLYKTVEKGIPWPLAAFENERSFLSIDNLTFLVEKMIQEELPSGIYNLADDQGISTNDLIKAISHELTRGSRLWNVPPKLIRNIARLGDTLSLPLNSERLKKLTESYIVSNQKIKQALGINKLPLTAKEGLLKTIRSFKKN